jgi:hypothetical protein
LFSSIELPAPPLNHRFGLNVRRDQAWRDLYELNCYNRRLTTTAGTDSSALSMILRGSLYIMGWPVA